MSSEKMELAESLENHVDEVIEVKTSSNKIHVRCKVFCPKIVKEICEEFGYEFYNAMYQGERDGDNILNAIFRK